MHYDKQLQKEELARVKRERIHTIKSVCNKLKAEKADIKRTVKEIEQDDLIDLDFNDGEDNEWY